MFENELERLSNGYLTTLKTGGGGNHEFMNVGKQNCVFSRYRQRGIFRCQRILSQGVWIRFQPLHRRKL